MRNRIVGSEYYSIHIYDKFKLNWDVIIRKCALKTILITEPCSREWLMVASN